MAKRDYYEVLGVARTATEIEITKAYRGLAKKYHPDQNPGDETVVTQYHEVTEAYEVLRDPQKRQVYDRYGHEGLHQRRAGGDGRRRSLRGLRRSPRRALRRRRRAAAESRAAARRGYRGRARRRSARGRDRHQEVVHGSLRGQLQGLRRQRGEAGDAAAPCKRCKGSGRSTSRPAGCSRFRRRAAGAAAAEW